ncbi:MAG: TetR/AcrR family transcriptional regulator [Streptococcaceae bacterium]|jgi:AcrR family transcriptional regulator|nr:TetR/AcrR family transcriptional regulator [Streptococcaceae bacterium]
MVTQSEKKKARVLEVTEEFLKTRAINEFTMDEVAESAEVSKVTIFKYFGSKDALVNQIMKQSLLTMVDKMREIIHSTLHYEDMYRAMTSLKVDEMDNMTPQYTANILTQFAQNPEFFDVDSRQMQRELTNAIFAKGREEGKIDPKFSDEELDALVTIFDEGLRHVNMDMAWVNEHSENLTQMFLNAVAKH